MIYDLDCHALTSFSLPYFVSPRLPAFSSVASCQSSVYVGSTTPASTPVALSAPHTPCYTPCCTPRRLSLSLSLAESSTNLRDSTKTTSTSLGLVRLLLEHGISASVYNPGSWDRGLNVSVPPGDRHSVRRPDTLLLPPSTPPKSSTSTATHPVFQFSPSPDDPPYYSAFLASKPARTILREVLGEADKERAAQTDDEMLNLRLVDKLKRFRTLSPHSASLPSGTSLFGTTGLGSGTLAAGLPGLNPGLRRNRTYPALVGASMAMKDPGGPASTDILIQDSTQTPNTQHTETSKIHTKSTLVNNSIHIAQTLHALVTPQTIIQRHARPSDAPWDPTRSEEETVP